MVKFKGNVLRWSLMIPRKMKNYSEIFFLFSSFCCHHSRRFVPAETRYCDESDLARVESEFSWVVVFLAFFDIVLISKWVKRRARNILIVFDSNEAHHNFFSAYSELRTSYYLVGVYNLLEYIYTFFAVFELLLLSTAHHVCNTQCVRMSVCEYNVYISFL